MKYSIFLILFLAFQTILAQDTFSIVAVDPETGEIGSAGASCVDGAASLGGVIIINQILPGIGAVNGQAWICVNPHINLDNAILRMSEGMSPQEIITWLQANDACASQNFNSEFRQYGIVDFDINDEPRAAAFTGSSADDYKGHIVGPNYAIQGNILLGPEILENMEAGFLNTSGDLAAKLMAALQGANVPGADSRCLARGTSSTSGYLRVLKSVDSPSLPYLEINVEEMPFGQETIDSIQTLYDAWNTVLSVEELQQNQLDLSIRPNPVKSVLHLKNNEQTSIAKYTLLNIDGKMLKSNSGAFTSNLKINTEDLLPGFYLLKVVDVNNKQAFKKFIKQ